uniref:GLUCAGON domain-containing protein n=1 Tax=Macrostomum lignano TaxID=282301 RepID=A0A1I8FTC2_9PLAT
PGSSYRLSLVLTVLLLLTVAASPLFDYEDLPLRQSLAEDFDEQPDVAAAAAFKRQFQLALNDAQLHAYIRQLEVYMKLLGRQRFGKRFAVKSRRVEEKKRSSSTSNSIDRRLKGIDEKLSLLLS